MPDAYRDEFLRVLLALREYLDDIVFVGGCVPLIYARYLFGIKAAVVFTEDVDVLVPNRVAAGDRTIASCLTTAGYVGRYLEHKHSQFFKFERKGGTGFEIEFLTPILPGNLRDTLVVQSDLRAQALPGLDLLIENCQEVTIRDRVDDVLADLVIRVPVPGAFILNKLSSYLMPLAGDDRSKDAYYVFQVMRSLPLDRQAVAREINACLDSRQVAALIDNLFPLFNDEFAEGTRSVAAQLTGLDMPEREKRLLVSLEMKDLFNAISG